MSEKSYLTPNEVAELLMVSPTAVRQWAEKGELKALTTPGGHRRFMPDDVERFAQKRGLTLNTMDNNALRVLIVDDDPSFTEYLTDLLQKADPPVITEVASEGFSAGLKVRRFKPQIILLDLKMPGLDGFQVCRLLKAEPATIQIRVIMMTGYATPENVENAVLAGAEACINKPLDVKEFFKLLGLKKSTD